MANVRIKDLTTTAATTASDDFFGVDGATNGTRKLSAYSPTFGGNLTVSGSSGANVFSGEIQANKSDSNLSFAAYGTTPKSGIWTQNDGTMVWADYATGTKSLKLNMTTGAATLSGNLTVSGTGGVTLSYTSGSPTAPVLSFSSAGGALGFYQSSNTIYFTSASVRTLGFTSTGLQMSINGSAANPNIATDAAGTSGLFAPVNNSIGFTLAGTEAARFAVTTGNFLLGTTTDGGQKLQVSGTAAISGALSIGNTVQTAVSVASTHKVTISIGGTTYYLLATNV